jgi:hypothetical protein
MCWDGYTLSAMAGAAAAIDIAASRQTARAPTIAIRSSV